MWTGITTDHTCVEAPHTDTEASRRKTLKIQKNSKEKESSVASRVQDSFIKARVTSECSVCYLDPLSIQNTDDKYTWENTQFSHPRTRELNSREISGILLCASYSRPVSLRIYFVLPAGLQNFSHCYEHMDMHLFSHFTFQGTQTNWSLGLTKTWVTWFSWSFIWCFKIKLVPVR